MKRRGWRSIVGISIVIGSLAVTVVANATLWQSDDLRYGRQFLTSSNFAGSNVYVEPYTGITNQMWTVRTEANQPGYYRFVAGFSTPTNPYVLDIPSSNLSTTYVQSYPLNGGANQSWLPVLRFWDATGAACYSFHSRLNHDWVLVKLQNGGHGNAAYILPQIYNQSQGQFWCAYVDGLTPQNPRPF